VVIYLLIENGIGARKRQIDVLEFLPADFQQDLQEAE